MAISLFDLTIPTYLQTVTAVQGFLDKGLEQVKAAGVSPAEIVDHRLCGDMLPFSFQIVSVAHHSLGAVEALKSGTFSPPGPSKPYDYAGLQGLIGETLEKLRGYTAADVNALEGKDVAFKIGDMAIPFTAENFVLSFSLPNLHFHATTAYDILRAKGAALGKRHYLGGMRIKAG